MAQQIGDELIEAVNERTASTVIGSGITADYYGWEQQMGDVGWGKSLFALRGCC
jgi:hypothetical protein